MRHVIYVLANRALGEAVEVAGAVVLQQIASYHAVLAARSDWDGCRGWAFHDWLSAVEAWEHPLPAWTNMDTRLAHIDPLPEDWRRIYGEVVQPVAEAAPYAEVTVEDIGAFAGHELTHHLRAFRATPPSGQRFEEGFCFAVPRRFVLPPWRQTVVRTAEATLVRADAEQLAATAVWDFGSNDDGSGWPAALYDYWRAIAVVLNT